MMLPRTFPLVAACVVLTSGCVASDPVVYHPEPATVLVDGFPATRYLVPPEEPRGEVRVASFGVIEVAPGTSSAPIVALHVRMVVSNHGDPVPWQIDTRMQLVDVPGEGRSAPLYVNGDAAPAAVVTVGLREQRTLDLYFPLPASVSSTLELPRFDFLWQVGALRRVVADRTTFDREEIEDVRAYRRVTVVAGWGPWWWYNPWPAPVFHVHPPRVIVHDHSRPPVIVVPRPHRIYVGHPQPPRPRPR